MKTLIDSLTEKAKNFVIIGEAGSGKTEISLSFALALKKQGAKEVHFFDMDQTKPLFRARDSENILSREGVVFHFQKQFMDAPTVASGVIESLKDPERFVLLDIGGGAYGSHMIGQFADWLNTGDTMVLYVLNPYRPWSDTKENIEETMRRTIGAAHLGDISLVANPNLGLETDVSTVLDGIRRIRGIFPDAKIEFLCCEDSLCEAVSAECDLPVLPVSLKTLPEWMR